MGIFRTTGRALGIKTAEGDIDLLKHKLERPDQYGFEDIHFLMCGDGSFPDELANDWEALCAYRVKRAELMESPKFKVLLNGYLACVAITMKKSERVKETV